MCIPAETFVITSSVAGLIDLIRRSELRVALDARGQLKDNLLNLKSVHRWYELVVNEQTRLQRN